MQTVYIGNTLINDVMLGSQRMDDVFTPDENVVIEDLVVAGGGGIAADQTIGGGGGGGLLSGSATLISKRTYNVQIGGGGDAQLSRLNQFGVSSVANGDVSYLTGSNLYLYAWGGGGGRQYSVNGNDGGSGGGGGGRIGSGEANTFGGAGNISFRFSVSYRTNS